MITTHSLVSPTLTSKLKPGDIFYYEIGGKTITAIAAIEEGIMCGIALCHKFSTPSKPVIFGFNSPKCISVTCDTVLQLSSCSDDWRTDRPSGEHFYVISTENNSNIYIKIYDSFDDDRHTCYLDLIKGETLDRITPIDQLFAFSLNWKIVAKEDDRVVFFDSKKVNV